MNGLRGQWGTWVGQMYCAQSDCTTYVPDRLIVPFQSHPWLQFSISLLKDLGRAKALNGNAGKTDGPDCPLVPLYSCTLVLLFS